MQTTASEVIIVTFQTPGGECRTITCREDSRGLLHLRELSMGPTTEAIFRASVRWHEITLEDSHLTVLGWILGASQTCRSGEELLPHLRRFFAGGEAFLSDLMDELDIAGIAYTYMSWVDNEGLFLRPSGPMLSAAGRL